MAPSGGLPPSRRHASGHLHRQATAQHAAVRPGSPTRLVRNAALLYVFATPLDIVPLPIGTPVTFAGAVFLCAWAVALLRGEVKPPRGGGLLLVLVALVVWSFTTIFWSYAPGVSITQAITTTFLVVSAIAVAGVFRGEVERPAGALALGSAIAGLAAIISGPDVSNGFSEQASFLGIDQNILAFNVALGLAASLFLMLGRHARSFVVVLLLLALIQTGALIMIGSRTGIGSAIALVIAYITLSLRNPRRAGIALAATLAAAWMVRSFSANELVPSRIQDWLQNPIAMDYRSEIIDAYRMTQADWIIKGVGAGADADYLLAVASWYKNAHSAFWRVWIELGLVGVLLWGLLLAGLAYRAWRSPNRAFFALEAVPIALFFYTLGPLGSNALWAVFGLAMGASAMVEAAEASSGGRSTVSRSRSSGQVSSADPHGARWRDRGNAPRSHSEANRWSSFAQAE